MQKALTSWDMSMETVGAARTSQDKGHGRVWVVGLAAAGGSRTGEGDSTRLINTESAHSTPSSVVRGVAGTVTGPLAYPREMEVKGVRLQVREGTNNAAIIQVPNREETRCGEDSSTLRRLPLVKQRHVPCKRQARDGILPIHPGSSNKC